MAKLFKKKIQKKYFCWIKLYFMLSNIKKRFCLSGVCSPHVLFIHPRQRVGLQEQVSGRKDVGGRIVISNRGFNLQLRPHDIRQP